MQFYQYGIKKKIPQDPLQDPGLEGRLGRKKKTPEELAAEASIDAGDTPAHSKKHTHTRRASADAHLVIFLIFHSFNLQSIIKQINKSVNESIG